MFAFRHYIFFPMGVKVKITKRIANSADPDETARYEPSHLDLRCLQKVIFRSAWLKS